MGFMDRIGEVLGEINPLKSSSSAAALKGLTGMDYSGLSDAGKKAYPDTAPGSAHHRLAAKLATQTLLDKIGWIPGGETVAQGLPQALGAGLEVSEAFGRMAGGVPGAGLREHFGMPDTLRDFNANAQGGQEAVDEYRRRKRARRLTGGRF